MAGKAMDLTFGIRLDEKGFTRGLDKAKGKIRGVDKEVSKIGKHSSAALNKAGSSAKGYGLKFAGAIMGPLAAVFAAGALANMLTKGIKESFTAAFETAKIDKILETQLKAIGSGGALNEMTSLADKVQKAFTIDDEDVKTGMTTMLKSMSLGQAKGLLGLTADIAKAKDITFDAASLIVSKTASGDITNLKQIGVILKSTGNLANDASKGLDALQKNFGGQGAAIAAVEPPGDALSLALGDLQETIGRSLMPILTPMIQYLTEFIDSLESSGSIKATFDTVVKFFKQGLDTWSTVWNAIVGGNWVELIWDLVKMAFKNLFAWLKVLAFGFLQTLGRFIVKMGLFSAKILFKGMKALLPGKLAKWLGVDTAIENVQKDLDNFDVVNDSVKDSFAEFGKSYMNNVRDFTSDLKKSNGETEKSAVASKGASKQMAASAEIYAQANIQGGVSAVAMQDAAGKSAKEAAKQTDKSTKSMEKQRKEMEKAKQTYGGYGGGGGGKSGKSQSGAMVHRGGNTYGYLGTSGYAPQYTVGGGPNSVVPMNDPGQAVALPQYDQSKASGDMSKFSGDQISKYGGGQELAAAYNSAYIQAYSSAANQNIKVQLYSQQQMHGSMVNT